MGKEKFEGEKISKFKKFKDALERTCNKIKEKSLIVSLYVFMSVSVFYSMNSCGQDTKAPQEVSDVMHDAPYIGRDGGYSDINSEDGGFPQKCTSEDLSKYVKPEYRNDFKMLCDNCKYDFGLIAPFDDNGNIDDYVQGQATEFIRFICKFDSRQKMVELCNDPNKNLTYVIATNKMPEKEVAIVQPEGVNKTNYIAHWELPISGDYVELSGNGCIYTFVVRNSNKEKTIPSYYTYENFFWAACQLGAIGKKASSSKEIYYCSPPCTIVIEGVYGNLACAQKMCCDYFKDDKRKDDICDAAVAAKCENI